MKSRQDKRFKRIGRGLIWAVLTAVVLTWLAACSGQAANLEQPTATTAAQPASLATATQPSPSATAAAQVQTQSTPTQTVANQAAVPAAVCSSPAALTPALTEGPFFKAGSPEQSSLLNASIIGKKLALTGFVLTTDCKPIAHALLDFWQADANGNYDNSGYTLRGHQFADASGRYQLTTIVPGLYPGRTEHIHVKVQAPNGPILTTQLFFPGVSGNQADGIFDQKLLIDVQENGSGLSGTFNFVVNE